MTSCFLLPPLRRKMMMAMNPSTKISPAPPTTMKRRRMEKEVKRVMWLFEREIEELYLQASRELLLLLPLPPPPPPPSPLGKKKVLAAPPPPKVPPVPTAAQQNSEEAGPHHLTTDPSPLSRPETPKNEPTGAPHHSLERPRQWERKCRHLSPQLPQP